MLILWFRDLSIPDGETIRRHQAVIESEGSVWWGWLKRRSEEFPNDYIVNLSRSVATEPLPIMLYHSDARQMYGAILSAISALPGGYRIRSPEMDLTPPYMHESVCPAWFELRKIEALSSAPAIRITGMPTLAGRAGVGEPMAGGAAFNDAPLRSSGATLWEIEVVQ